MSNWKPVGNERGVVEPGAVTMRAFDQLPPELRRALANSTFNYATSEYLTRVRSGLAAADVAAAIEREDHAHQRRYEQLTMHEIECLALRLRGQASARRRALMAATVRPERTLD